MELIFVEQVPKGKAEHDHHSQAHNHQELVLVPVEEGVDQVPVVEQEHHCQAHHHHQEEGANNFFTYHVERRIFITFNSADFLLPTEPQLNLTRGFLAKNLFLYTCWFIKVSMINFLCYKKQYVIVQYILYYTGYSVCDFNL